MCATGMLRHWDDSQKYLSDNPHLVCEETANYLVVICIDLTIDEVSAARKVGPKKLVLAAYMRNLVMSCPRVHESRKVD